jgi:hypothetical protein
MRAISIQFSASASGHARIDVEAHVRVEGDQYPPVLALDEARSVEATGSTTIANDPTWIAAGVP